MTKTLAAIETSYAGCRFRSRLEARWAVFFDSLKVLWQYEPQGYTVGPDATPYLPDFWLPEMELWVEVKGVLDQAALETLIWAAGPAGLPMEPGGGAATSLFPWRQRVLLLGDVPAPDKVWLHSRLDSIADQVVALKRAAFWPTRSGGVVTVEISEPSSLNQYIAGSTADPGVLRDLVEGIRCPLGSPSPRITGAYRAARSARFEHGESGA